MKKIVFTNHARLRLQERTIEPEWLERTARWPSWTEPDPRRPDIERRFREVPEFANRILRVACVETRTTIRVISVMFDRKAKTRR